jgi:hypothetical protein
VKIAVLSQINLKEHPEIIKLVDTAAGEELADLLKLPPD